MRLFSYGLGLAGLASAALQFSPNCPYFTEDDWVLVRRAKDNAHAATDHLVGNVAYGTPTTDIFDRSVITGQFHPEINVANARYQPPEESTHPNGEPNEFSIDYSGWDYTTFMFASGDCNLWMKLARDEAIISGTNNPVTSSNKMNWNILESHYQNYAYEVEQYNVASWAGDPAVAFTNSHPYSAGGDPIDCNAIYMGNNYEVDNPDINFDCGPHNGNQFGDLYNGLSVFVKKKECPPGYNYGYTGLREVCWFTHADTFAPDSVTWYMANDACAAVGGEIAVPRVFSELQFIYDRTAWRHNAFLSWTGISNIENNGRLIDHYTGQDIPQYISWDLDGRGQYVAFRGSNGEFIDYGGVTTGSTKEGVTTGFVCFEAPSCESGTGEGTCIAYGDPHVRTFDKSWNDMYEQADYTLAEAQPAAMAAGAQYFHAKMETKMDSNGEPISFADATSLEFQSYDGATSYYIRLESDSQVYASLNGEAEQPFSTTNNKDFELRNEGGRLTLTTWFGVKLIHDRDYVQLDLPKRYRSNTGDRTAGICGNFNCDASDDWTEKDGTTCVGGTYGGGDDDWTCMNKAACSFITNAGDADNQVSCPTTPNAPPQCTDVALTNSCQALFDDSSFDACKLIVDGYASFLDACATDICRVNDPDEYRCMLIDMFYKECQRSADPSRDDLTDDFCDYTCPFAKTCPPDMVWNNCATCEDRYTCQEFLDGYNCNDGYYTTQHTADAIGACVCQPGFKLDNGVCINQDDCQPTPPAWSEWGEWTECTGSCFPGGSQTRARICLGPGECDTQWWQDNHGIDLGSTIEIGMCNVFVMCPVETTAPPAAPTEAPVSGPAMVDGTCWSGNWTKYFDLDDGSDGVDLETFTDHTAAGNVNCPMISAVQARIVGNEDAVATSDTISLSGTGGTVECIAADQDDTDCQNYEVRFCCEGCCPYLNISGNPELTDYYENYPGIYELTDEIFNGAMVYRLMDGVDDVGEVVYGMGVVYYWEDVGWLLGANTFTYSYYSDGIGEICPQHAPKNWTNEVFGTQLNVECLPVYPSCNDVECVDNACCVMRDEGPVCECIDGYELYEDGSCLAPITDPIVTDGVCDTPGHEWTDYLNADTELGFGDWEALRSFPQVCGHPSAVEASRVDALNVDPQVVHISKEYGFWCINNEQDFQGNNPTGSCIDWQVRFCCPKTEAGTCDVASGNYAWTSFASHDTSTVGIGDFETITSMGERDLCSSPTGVRAQTIDPAALLDEVTHIDVSKGFWCLNEEQDSGACNDYEVSFCCPIPKKDDMNITYIADGTCSDAASGWTPFMSTDDPTGDGDYETLGNVARMMACANPTGIMARTAGPGATENVHINVNAGFWCVNAENSEDCADWEVSFCCPMYKTGDCTDGLWTGWYNDEWDKKNERIWVSSREEREDIIMHGDGAACANPTQAEIRPRPTGSTSYQTTMWEYSTHLIDHLSPAGYHCINEEQVDGYKCIDMEVRFCCPTTLEVGECSGEGAEWSNWMSADTADGAGDFEINYNPTTCWDTRT